MTTDEHVRGRVWRDLVVSHSVILGKMEADLRTTTGLTLGQYDVLLRLHEAPGNTIRMGDLAELVLVTTSGVTRVVDRLVEAGPVRPPLVDISAPHLEELTAIVAAGRAVLADELAVR